MKTCVVIAIICMLFGQWPAALLFGVFALVLKPR